MPQTDVRGSEEQSMLGFYQHMADVGQIQISLVTYANCGNAEMLYEG